MSLFGAMNTAISGLSAQSASFSNISDDVSNSQTVGFKGVDTSFTDYLTSSTATQNQSGSVASRPQYANSVQGTLTQSSDPLAMAITGNGFFPVSAPTTNAAGTAALNVQPMYSRAGDFSLDNAGYLANGSGLYLNGWPVDPTTGVVNTSLMSPIQVDKAPMAPVATTVANITANLPATPTAATPVSSQVQIYDAVGTAHAVELNWTQTSANNWTVAVNVPDNTGGAAVGGASVAFGSGSGNAVPEGTVGAISGATGGVSSTSYSAGGQAALTLTLNFGSGPQTVQVGMGTFGVAGGLTQYAGTAATTTSVSQNGNAPGAFQSVNTNSDGEVVATYDNGQTRTLAQVPVITFESPDQLQRQNGQAFTATTASGQPVPEVAGQGGAGSIVAGSVENSNVDIASELSQLIVAQQAYSANAKVITSANQLLQTTIDMKQ